MTIDWWTLGFQTVNVVILVWLLKRFFWRPIAAMIEQRRATAQRTLAEAEAARRKAADALGEIERTRAGFAKERETILAAAHEEAERARTARLDEAAKEVAVLEAAAKSAIEKEKEAAEKVWTERSSRLAVEIAERLASRLDGPAVRATFPELFAGSAMTGTVRIAMVLNSDGTVYRTVREEPAAAGRIDATSQLSQALGIGPDELDSPAEMVTLNSTADQPNTIVVAFGVRRNNLGTSSGAP